MNIVWMIIFFLYGLLFGSFFNVVGLRVPMKQSIVSPPSHCPHCNRRLSVKDLIPAFSYLFLRGRCGGCGLKISPIYPFFEFITGVLFAYTYVYFGFQWELLVSILFISLLIIISVSDVSYMIIPDKVLLPFAIVFLLLRIVIPLNPFYDSILGAAVGFGILYLIAVLSKGGMGGGDIKLFFVIGLVLGTIQTLLTLFLASLIGGIAGMIIVKRSGKGRKTPIPFGPSISIAAILSYFWGRQFVEWYQQFFF